MFYLTQMLGKPVVDAAGEVIGEISDVAIATGEVFPRVTSLAFLGPDKTPFMLSWRKYVQSLDEDCVRLNSERSELRFSYLQPDEILLARDLLNKQIVDTQGKKVVRVNDLKLSESGSRLRLLGAEVGIRGLLRAIHPSVERAAAAVTRLFGRELPEKLIPWNYVDLLDRDLSQVRLSVTHKRLHELHPADVADVLEQLSPAQRARVFEHLDNVQAALAVAELEDELQADLIGELGDQRASDILEEMDPDDAADIIGDLPYEKAEALLRLMGVKEARAIRSLLGYKEKTAGGIMTPEVTTVTDEMTVQEVIDLLRREAAEQKTIYYIYVVDEEGRLEGVISLRDLVISDPKTPVADLVTRDFISVGPDDDQEAVAETMSKYDLLALPVVDETGKLLGIVTVDDALEVMEEESAEDLAIATGAPVERGPVPGAWWWLIRRNAWLLVWGLAFVVFMSLSSALTSHMAGEPSIRAVGVKLASWAVALLPLVLRTAEDLSTRVLAEMIEADESAKEISLGRRLLREALIGIAPAAVSALAAFGLAYIFLGEVEELVMPFTAATAASALLTALLGGALGHLVIRRSLRGKPVSGTGLALLMMSLAALLYLAIAYGVGVAWAASAA